MNVGVPCTQYQRAWSRSVTLIGMLSRMEDHRDPHYTPFGKPRAPKSRDVGEPLWRFREEGVEWSCELLFRVDSFCGVPYCGPTNKKPTSNVDGRSSTGSCDLSKLLGDRHDVGCAEDATPRLREAGHHVFIVPTARPLAVEKTQHRSHEALRGDARIRRAGLFILGERHSATVRAQEVLVR
jgi:hypothetical protein